MRVTNLVGRLTSLTSRSLQPPSPLALAGVGTILAAGLIHLILVPEHFEEASYLGGLFAAHFVGAILAAFGIYRGRRWGWLLGALIAAGSLAAYAVSATIGLPGAEKGSLLEPVGVLTKVIEILFLVLCAFEFTRIGRWVMAAGIPMVILSSGLATGLALALDNQSEHDAGHGQQDEKPGGKTPAGLPVRWTATSPAIHLGDQYELTVTNTSQEDQNTQVRAMIMDHRAHKNTTVVSEPLELAPGEERELTAANDYGDANHFQTTLGSDTKDLGLVVKVFDPEGNEKARFNQEAFLIQDGKQKAQGKA
jgi:hypothetical protein